MKRKLDHDAIERIIGALQAGADMALAARIVGCSRQALYKRKAKDKKFAERVDEARAIADERVVTSLFKMATEQHNVTAAIFWLKNRRPDEWCDRRELRHEGPGLSTLAEDLARGRELARRHRAELVAEERGPRLLEPRAEEN